MCVRLLLKHGASATSRDCFGRPVLMVASITNSGNVQRDACILCDLLNHGADEDPLIIAHMTLQVSAQRCAFSIPYPPLKA